MSLTYWGGPCVDEAENACLSHTREAFLDEAVVCTGLAKVARKEIPLPQESP